MLGGGPNSQGAPRRCARQSDTMVERAPRFRRTTRATRQNAFWLSRPRTPAARESPMDQITTQPKRDARETTSGPRRFGCASSRASQTPTCSAISRFEFSAQTEREQLGSPIHVGNQKATTTQSFARISSNTEHELGISQRKPRRTRNDRNPISPRERIPPRTPHSISRCSRVGRSPNLVTRIISSTVITSPRLSQPGSTRPCRPGTTRCS